MSMHSSFFSFFFSPLRSKPGNHPPFRNLFFSCPFFAPRHPQRLTLPHLIQSCVSIMSLFFFFFGCQRVLFVSVVCVFVISSPSFPPQSFTFSVWSFPGFVLLFCSDCSRLAPGPNCWILCFLSHARSRPGHCTFAIHDKPTCN